jgi:sugar phosphate isomerase/epimerase
VKSYAIGYSTCGFAAGRGIIELIEVLAGLGYTGVELELDRDRLHPHVHEPALFREVRAALARTGLAGVIGTGARNVLTEVRHHPGLVSERSDERRRWLDFVKDGLVLAGELDCDTIMIHSGYTPSQVPVETAWHWVEDGLGELAEAARRHGRRLALEWHPEMFVRTASDYRRAARAVATRTAPRTRRCRR